jgi:hypothetical protein
MKIDITNNIDTTETKSQLNMLALVRRSYCSCGNKWSTDTNKIPPEDLSIICNKCGGYVTVDQLDVLNKPIFTKWS